MAKSILLIGNHPPPFGGVPTHIRYLAPFLVSRGWRVTIVSFQSTGCGDLPAVTHVDGYTIYRPTRSMRRRALASFDSLLKFAGGAYRLPNESGPQRLFTLSRQQFIRSVARRHEVKLISAYHMHAGLWGAWLGLEMGIPLVTTLFGEVYSSPDEYRALLPQMRLVVEQSIRLLSCSQHCANSLRTIGLEANVEPVLYGIDTERFSPSVAATALRDEMKIPPGNRVVGFIGRMVEVMGLATLLAAASRVLPDVANVHFLIVGSAGDLTSEAQAMAKQFPGRVHVRVSVPADVLPVCYAASDVVVVPSTNERACLGLAIVEAMSTGRAVIATRVGGHAEVLREGETGLMVPARDPEQLAATLTRLLAQPDRLAAMGRRGREVAVASWDKDLTNQRMEEIFLSASEG